MALPFLVGKSPNFEGVCGVYTPSKFGLTPLTTGDPELLGAIHE